MLKEVISGGQTGVDVKGLEVARRVGLKTGGTAPKGFRTENGPNYDLRDLYGLKESQYSSYPPRTRDNVVDSVGTVVFGNLESSGSLETIHLCSQFEKPCIKNPSAKNLIEFINTYKVEVLNVAGNRGSRISAQRLEEVDKVLYEVFTFFKQMDT